MENQAHGITEKALSGTWKFAKMAGNSFVHGFIWWIIFNVVLVSLDPDYSNCINQLGETPTPIHYVAANKN